MRFHVVRSAGAYAPVKIGVHRLSGAHVAVKNVKKRVAPHELDGPTHLDGPTEVDRPTELSGGRVAVKNVEKRVEAPEMDGPTQVDGPTEVDGHTNLDAPTEVDEKSERERRAIEREIKILKLLRHPNIVRSAR